MAQELSSAQRVVRDFIDAVNRRDHERLSRIWTEDATAEAPGDVRLEGASAVTDYVMAWIAAFPDVRVKTGTSVASGDWVALEYSFEGTHNGPLAGPGGEVQPTHRQVAIRVAIVCRTSGEKIAEIHGFWDQLQVLTQLGLMPEPASA